MGSTILTGGVLLLVLLLPGTGLGQPEPPAEAIRAIIASARLEGLGRPDLGRERDLLQRLYEPAAYASLWLDGGHLSARGKEAIAALQTTATKGLDPRDYEAAWLAAEADRLAAVRKVSPADLARFDVALSVALVRLISDLQVGRVDPWALHFHYDRESERSDLAALVTAALTGGRIQDVIAAAEPHVLENRLLQQQLARYRQLAADPEIAPVVLAAKTRPGDRFAAAPRLARWLEALGDLRTEAVIATGYDDVLVEAVQRFQSRHGLTPDGIIGAATAKALAVPASARVRQIELALERLRWLPALRDRTLIVNVPGFELLAFAEIDAGRPPALAMSVVVGRAARTETPFFAGTMTHAVFAPYWNIPESILRKEILPKLRAQPEYLAKEQMEIVSAGGVLAPTAEAIAQLARGDAELRQRPGAKNALGRVKFLFPNPYHVYMHDTPARELFARSRRDFSHGCIRLADAPGLAHWVLGGEGWEEGRIDAMLDLRHQTFVPLRRPITVVIAYATAVARPDDTISFYDDIYEHDAALELALIERAYRR